ncbi:UNVERIFIED_CONTAM: hypothetical protein RMT77_000669 [Armadillidium vulgare]
MANFILPRSLMGLGLGVMLCVIFGLVGQTATSDSSKLKLNKVMGPSLKFLYWKVFEQYAGILHEKYPDISIFGDNYPPPDWRVLFAQILGIAKLILLGCVLFGLNLWEMMGAITPPWFTWLTQNKIYGGMMIFFLSNALEGQLMSTGAFEITFNDVPVWSKLETGRIPQPNELFQIIDNHVRLNQDSFSWSDTI